MRRNAVLALGLVAALALPAGAAAKPTETDRTNAAKECKLERGTTTETKAAFAAKYGTNANKRNAFGKCVSQRAKEEAKERREATTEASTTCRTERDADAQAFAEKYGTNKNKKNAFGKCVSQKAHELEAAEDQQDRAEIRRKQDADGE